MSLDTERTLRHSIALEVPLRGGSRNFVLENHKVFSMGNLNLKILEKYWESSRIAYHTRYNYKAYVHDSIKLFITTYSLFAFLYRLELNTELCKKCL